MKPVFFVLLTVFATVASQVFFKLAVKNLAVTGTPLLSIALVFNPMVVAGLLFSIVSIASWLAALTQLKLSTAYPFMSLTFPLVVVASSIFFGESVSLIRWLGILLIMVGLIVLSSVE